MPKPVKGEKKQHFVSRCVSYLHHVEGVKDDDHAIAKCYGIYEQWKKKGK